MELEERTMTVPAGTPGEQPLRLDIAEILSLEARKEEAATVSKVKAPELMAAMERGYSCASRLLTMVTWEVKKAESAVLKRRSIVVLEIAPQYLQERGLVTGRSPGGSEDQRTSVLSTDAEFVALSDNVDQLKAVQEFLKIKVRGFEMTFSAIKKVYDTLSGYGMMDTKADRSYPANVNTNTTAGDTTGHVGKPRY